MNNYKPFDLATALAKPELVITSDGRKVSEIVHLKTASKDNEDMELIAVIDGRPYGMYVNGKRYLKVDDKYDLFLLPEEKKVWINVYRSVCGDEFETGCRTHSTEEKAKVMGKPCRSYHATVEITIPI